METPKVVLVIVLTLCALAVVVTLSLVVSSDFRSEANGVAILFAAIATSLTTMASLILGISGAFTRRTEEREHDDEQ